MPRCDFSCRGCYLGAEANDIPPAPLDEIRQQLVTLRGWLGHGGNVQLTDGELTLRPLADLIALVQAARGLGLVPMLMTHGDLFRRRPEALIRLVREGGLRELSLHVDTTQVGRRGDAYRQARSEAELLPLRDEFAALIRRVRQETGRPLDVATTFTVTAENLPEVPLVMDWLRRHPGAFKMISFQPVAQVGRTAAGLGGSASVEALWDRIAEGLLGPGASADALRVGLARLGHPDCSRFVQGVILRRPGREPRFHPLVRRDDARDAAAVMAFLARFGGVTTRLDTPAAAAARAAGILVRAPGLVLRHLAPYLARLLRRLAPGDPLRLAFELLRGRSRVDYLNVVSHHFMSAAEIATPEGQERVALCVFQVPVDGQLRSMCEVNALGLRSRAYEALARRRRVRPEHPPAVAAR